MSTAVTRARTQRSSSSCAHRQLAWDLAFVLIGGLGLMLIGYLLAGARRAAAGADAEPMSGQPLT